MFGWLDELNPEQRRAVLHDDGHLLIVAGAGSGKTRTLACRVARLLAGGARPERILLLTFSRRAAREMLHRAGQLAEAEGARRVWGGTFHAVANRLLRQHGAAVGLRPGFTVLDQGDNTDLLGLVRHDLGLGEKGRRFPKKDTLASIYSRTVNAQEKLADVVERSYPWCRDDLDGIKEVFTGYVERKRAGNVVDYDDLLLYWRALATSSSVGPILHAGFDHILVDEFQDTNAVQADIVVAMAGPGVWVAAVGDDAQAIYGFRSGSARHMLEFPERFPGAEVVTLDRNYRSTPPVLAAANAVIAEAEAGFAKELRAVRAGEERPALATCADELAQSTFVCDSVLERRERGVPLRQQAVLFRTGHHSDGLDLELARRNIPFVKYGGLKFLEAAHVKDLLSLLRILENPSDEMAWLRVLGLIEGVGPATTRRLIDELRVAEAEALVRLLSDDCPRFPVASATDIAAVRSALADCVAADVPPAAQVERLGKACAPLFARRYPGTASVRLADLEHLRSMATGYTSRSRFLAELTLDPPSATGDLAGPPHLDDDWLVLSTIHSAKGGEWQVVHLIHASDGNLPSDMALGSAEEVEEERRLLYVALTRARDTLVVSYPLRYYVRRQPLDDAHTYGQPSRFLTKAAAAFDSVTVGETVVADDPVIAELAALWQ
ncbi:MAG TPA: ATP-dependent helicase [Acidimicrobiales bacterium]|nr:ATP-dependent helicase [Acidimicrobiales bacterium]